MSEQLSPGTYTRTWNAEGFDEGEYEIDFDASKLSSGVYFYRLSTVEVGNDEESIGQTFTSIRKMLLLR